MGKGRLEAFTDGVIAVVITIMVLELRVPSEGTWRALLEDGPVFLSYILSFIYVGIYWNNHHHMLQLVQHVNGKVMWANLFFLFCLSLFPFSTAWLNKAHPQPAVAPAVFYGITLWLAAVSWEMLARTLISANGGPGSELRKALGSDRKTRLSISIQVCAIALAYANPVVSCALYAIVAAMWFIPDRRIERRLGEG
ncbi:TMEM175 family protein [Dyella sp. EPa41]|uniref:TMEM175 family protein n=1 Tax=Dyella sp. EPa41 TaxID=1561194 RepID=UPI0019159FC8|nr:TMEM175 family protein [Dyella sp. EPa41]